ncbi:hypothetical protein C7N43_09305 [Sphingobacteriales bacterium UPWRP_1]|nr:hypothetical protein B6N25_07970 [Sphingobacteriales bacterium TSM_CSS]PSJ77326.1 hypothetical protein C7N43_09305 [Sphingobacteriales bacterium UPWRP_1]
MKFVKLLSFLLLLGGASAFVNAQDLSDYGIPTDLFPAAPSQEEATAVVNFNLDLMGLNPGANLLHTDEASKVKLYAFYSPFIKKYALYAVTEDNKDVPIEIIPSQDRNDCIFAYIGKDWVNVVLSQRFTYTTLQEAKDSFK